MINTMKTILNSIMNTLRGHKIQKKHDVFLYLEKRLTELEGFRKDTTNKRLRRHYDEKIIKIKKQIEVYNYIRQNESKIQKKALDIIALESQVPNIVKEYIKVTKDSDEIKPKVASQDKNISEAEEKKRAFIEAFSKFKNNTDREAGK